MSDTYEVFAVRYATMQNRRRGDNFIMADPHDAIMPIDYYVWALVNEERTIVVDTGFNQKEADARGRELFRLPREGLAMIDIDSAAVEDVIVTHLHYDHAGTLDHFPRAQFHIQDAELRYTTGRHMCQELFSYPYAVEHVTRMVENVFAGRVRFHDGDAELYPGVSLHLIGGHTMGLQAVRVNTKRGPVVLASDASHFYENMEKISPFPVVYSVGDMVQGYDKLRRLAPTEKHIVPGHDPMVMDRYPAPSADNEKVIVRLDVEPTE